MSRPRPYVKYTTPAAIRQRTSDIAKLHQRQFDEYISRARSRNLTYSFKPRTHSQYRQDKLDAKFQSKWAAIVAQDTRDRKEQALQDYAAQRSNIVYGPLRPLEPYYQRNDDKGWMHFSDTYEPGSKIVYPPGSRQFYPAFVLKNQPFVLARIRLNRLKALKKLRQNKYVR